MEQLKLRMPDPLAIICGTPYPISPLLILCKLPIM